ncbi:hypothetical protein ACO1O0_003356 [Amphichorda felina]
MSNYGGYGGRPNPYDQRESPAGSYGGGYNAPPSYGQASYGGGGGGSRYDQPQTSIDGGYAGSGVEMAPLAQHGASVGRTDPNAILNECRDIDRGIEGILHNLDQLRALQQRTLDDADASSTSAANRQLDSLSAETMVDYRTLTERVRQVKSNPDSRTPKNNPQVSRVDRSLKDAIRKYQSYESQFRKRTQDQMARQYRIVRPDASEEEVRAAVEDTSSNGQVFQQALMHSDRQGRARAALSAVQDRHDALVKIEQQMIELSQLFQDMDTLVVQQEAAVAQIEQKGEEVVENLDKGNEEMAVAVDTARSTRKKKWICLGISVAIVVIVVVIVVIYFLVIKPDQNNGGGGGGGGGDNSANKRDIIQTHPFITGIPIHSRIVGRNEANDAIAQVAKLVRERMNPQLPA